MRRLRWLLAVLAAFLVLLLAWVVFRQVWQVEEIRGLVMADGQPIAGSIVRVKATDFEVSSDEQGRFVLNGFPPRFSIPVTAWVDGYYIGGTTAYPWKRTVEISLRHYWTSDNPDYSWIPPAVEDRSAVEDFIIQAGLSTAAKLSFNQAFLPLASRLKLGCADCHGGTINGQWEASTHAQGTGNIRFLTMYNGTDVRGNQSPPTRYGVHRDYGRFPLRPDPDQPNYGPGFKLDFPDQAGNCATCHAPTAALADPYGTDINRVQGVAALGTHCDFCHKVVNVRVDPVTLLPYENMPGILSMELRRPNGEPQLFFGPFDDVDVGPDTFSPLQNESRFCAACHNATFWGTPIYQSYAEWVASPYPREGKNCQSCHMKPDGTTTNFAPGRGGLERDPQKVFTHSFPGAADTVLLQNTAKLELRATRQGNVVSVKVLVTNENAGHHIPTDHPMRNIILVVTATDNQGRALELLEGSRVPAWGGVGTAPDDYAGQPGRGYAKVLEELWTEVSPTVAYWRQTVVREDTRIAARATDRSSYRFSAPFEGAIRVEAKLVFRRAFKELASVKGWDIQDIEMERETALLP